jgi:hypothetical protein
VRRAVLDGPSVCATNTKTRIHQSVCQMHSSARVAHLESPVGLAPQCWPASAKLKGSFASRRGWEAWNTTAVTQACSAQRCACGVVTTIGAGLGSLVSRLGCGCRLCWPATVMSKLGREAALKSFVLSSGCVTSRVTEECRRVL